MVLQALSEREAALLLFKTPEGRKERARMIEADEHLHRPRGRLVYHIELVGLLGACALGRNAAAEMMVRYLPMSPYISLYTRYLPVSPYISIYLPIAPYSSL